MSRLEFPWMMPFMASLQFAMAFMSLSSGVMLGLVMDLCWNWTVSESLSLRVDLM
jgi:hypothetical protein